MTEKAYYYDKDNTKLEVPSNWPQAPLPCPWCNDWAQVQSWHGGGPSKHLVACSSEDCLVGPGTIGPFDIDEAAQTRDGAIAAWNNRSCKTQETQGEP